MMHCTAQEASETFRAALVTTILMQVIAQVQLILFPLRIWLMNPQEKQQLLRVFKIV